MTQHTQMNPLSAYFRAPKLHVRIPSRGRLYSPDVIEMPESGELPVLAMTAKDEINMKNPDALLNGEAIAGLIASCVPCVKRPRELFSNDVDVLLVAIQAATYGDDIEVSARNPNDPSGEPVRGVVSGREALDTIEQLEESYQVKVSDLTIDIRPITYGNTLKASLASFETTRDLASLREVEDDLERVRIFSENFNRIADLNFSLLVDAVHSVKAGDVTVTDRAQIREFLENTDSQIGTKIKDTLETMTGIGIAKEMEFRPEVPEDADPKDPRYQPFVAPVNFDPVGFFTASLRELSQQKL
jgi:hypothetical protein